MPPRARNKQGIYAALGVPELWRYTRNTLLVDLRVEGAYQRAEQSRVLPVVPVAQVGAWIEQSRPIGQRSAVRWFRQCL